MEFKDYYDSLGVTKQATAPEIKKAFRKQARKFHPDVNPGDVSAENRFKGINEAYEVLGDADKRRKYDELGSNWKQYEQTQGAPFSGGSPFGGAGDGGFRWSVNTAGEPQTMSKEEAREMFGGDPFSDFFNTFFSGEGRTRTHRPHQRRNRKGRNVEHPIALTLEQAAAGVTERLLLKTGGRTRSVEVRIPAGVTSGSRVRVAGEGAPGTDGGPAGDFYLKVKLSPHPVFEVKGRDLYLKTRVPVTTAVLGGDVSVPTPSGKSLRLGVPETTQQGQVFRLKGQGLPALGKAATGDMYATVEVVVPTDLSLEAREHYDALARLETRAPGSSDPDAPESKTKGSAA
jgi:curved DNA-binding protein